MHVLHRPIEITPKGCYPVFQIDNLTWWKLSDVSYESTVWIQVSRWPRSQHRQCGGCYIINAVTRREKGPFGKRLELFSRKFGPSHETPRQSIWLGHKPLVCTYCPKWNVLLMLPNRGWRFLRSWLRGRFCLFRESLIYTYCDQRCRGSKPINQECDACI
jgi:hypothetical protein